MRKISSYPHPAHHPATIQLYLFGSPVISPSLSVVVMPAQSSILVATRAKPLPDLQVLQRLIQIRLGTAECWLERSLDEVISLWYDLSEYVERIYGQHLKRLIDTQKPERSKKEQALFDTQKKGLKSTQNQARLLLVNEFTERQTFISTTLLARIGSDEWSENGALALEWLSDYFCQSYTPQEGRMPMKEIIEQIAKSL